MQTLYIHPKNPQARLISQAVQALTNDQLIIYPTGLGYAFGVSVTAKTALDKLCRLADGNYPFSLLCDNLSQIAHYADVSNAQHRLLKSHASSQTALTLVATKAVPKKLLDNQKSISILLATTPLTLALLEGLNAPIVSLPIGVLDGSLEMTYEIAEHFNGIADLLIDDGSMGCYIPSVVSIVDDITLTYQGTNNPNHLLD
ncbi:Sua5/YciO/YrdC/YwlC family protein [Moraxella nasovis]|uniref:Sua5/YciO/YrdC/YwlC family protein n=1 Tax=Moraxella nasovis TaxID=2904121 RepID=UPI001F609425|nr:Sua5/YciO/YrdC/YwlC family protein [Moraxella nasovis]UNU72712.1 Sua5/YciO/YrdC/YwlC family protein [Moraxella nasovis]